MTSTDDLVVHRRPTRPQLTIRCCCLREGRGCLSSQRGCFNGCADASIGRPRAGDFGTFDRVVRAKLGTEHGASRSLRWREKRSELAVRDLSLEMMGHCGSTQKLTRSLIVTVLFKSCTSASCVDTASGALTLLLATPSGKNKFLKVIWPFRGRFVEDSLLFRLISLAQSTRRLILAVAIVHEWRNRLAELKVLEG